jgi:hypothetical protein
MIKRVILFVLCLSAAALAQNGGLTVSVQDPTGKAVSGARVDISARPISGGSAATAGKASTGVQFPHYNGSADPGITNVIAGAIRMPAKEAAQIP